MKSVLFAIVGMFAAGLIFVTDARPDLPPGVQENGLYPVEQDILDAISRLAPALAAKLRKKLPKRDSIFRRKAEFEEALRKYDKKGRRNPFLNQKN